MKQLSYVPVPHGQKEPVWNLDEVRDIFASPPSAALGYGLDDTSIIQVLEAEYKHLKPIVENYKSHASGSGDLKGAGALLLKILWCKIQELKQPPTDAQDTQIVKNSTSSLPDASRLCVVSNYSIEDLRARYGLKSIQGMVQWIKNNLDAINKDSPVPIQKVGKYWQIPTSALPTIDKMRRKVPERQIGDK